MTTQTEGQHAGEFIASEASGTRSREDATILLGENLKAGAVLGKDTTGAAVAAAIAGNTGDGAFGAVTVGAGAKPGVYKVTCIEPAANAGIFSVEDPDGIEVGVATVAAAFSGGGLGFTIADGAADFVAGDSFTVTVAAGSGKYEEYDPTATNGAEKVAGILHDNVDATAADKAGVALVRDAEIIAASLQWFTGANAAQIATGTAELAALGLIAR